MTVVRQTGTATNAVTRDLVSAETAAGPAALPQAEKLLTLAQTIAGQRGLVYGLRELAMVHVRAILLAPDRVDVDEAQRIAAECRRLVEGVELVCLLSLDDADPASPMSPSAWATWLADGYVVTQTDGTRGPLAREAARRWEERHRAIAAHLAVAGRA